MRGRWSQVTEPGCILACAKVPGGPAPRVWPEQERWWELPGPEVAVSEYRRLPQQGGWGAAMASVEREPHDPDSTGTVESEPGVCKMGWVVKGLKHGVTPSTGSLSSERVHLCWSWRLRTPTHTPRCPACVAWPCWAPPPCTQPGSPEVWV